MSDQKTQSNCLAIVYHYSQSKIIPQKQPIMNRLPPKRLQMSLPFTAVFFFVCVSQFLSLLYIYPYNSFHGESRVLLILNALFRNIDFKIIRDYDKEQASSENYSPTCAQMIHKDPVLYKE